MNKKLTFAALLAITLLGSLFTALGSNMFFSDVVNKDSHMINGLMVTMPALMFACLFPVMFLFVIRFYLRPKTLKRLARLYLIIAVSLSGIGFICSILSGVLYYHSFVKPYPFSGYLIIFMILHLLVIGCAVYAFIRLRKLPEDEEKFKVGPKHVFKTIGWFLFFCLTLNRLGMFIASPMYIHWRTFYMTFPFYLFLLVPVFIGTVKILTMLEMIPSKKLRIILDSSALGVAVVLFAVIVVLALHDTVFISATSPAMPLERLASMPIESFIHIASYIAVGTILLVQSIKVKE